MACIIRPYDSDVDIPAGVQPALMTSSYICRTRRVRQPLEPVQLMNSPVRMVLIFQTFTALRKSLAKVPDSLIGPGMKT
jgi:hypothetical protein